MITQCSIDGCDISIRYKKLKLCNKHYLRFTRHGKFSLDRASPKEPHLWLIKHIRHKCDECLIWPYSKSSSGYGQIVISGKKQNAHRIMCYMVNGNPKDKYQQARHLCGNGGLSCVNPLHVMWGSKSQNEQDKILHNTSNHGIRNGMSKLNDGDVIEICKRFSSELDSKLISELSLEFNVGKSAIYSIYSGRSWSWLTKRGEI